MLNTIHILLAVVLGSILAIFYFGGLWWTIRRLPIASHPAALYFASLLMRLVIVMTVFFIVISYSDWPSLTACLVGFLSTRLAVIRFLGRDTKPLCADGVN